MYIRVGLLLRVSWGLGLWGVWGRWEVVVVVFVVGGGGGGEREKCVWMGWRGRRGRGGFVVAAVAVAVGCCIMEKMCCFGGKVGMAGLTASEVV